MAPDQKAASLDTVCRRPILAIFEIDFEKLEGYSFFVQYDNYALRACRVEYTVEIKDHPKVASSPLKPRANRIGFGLMGPVLVKSDMSAR